jgi:hypothetical protein
MRSTAASSASSAEDNRLLAASIALVSVIAFLPRTLPTHFYKNREPAKL